MATKKYAKHAQPLIEALSRVDFSTVAPRPQILQGCTESDLKNFVKSFEHYELQGGTLPAVTFVHVDVVVFFKHTKHVDLSASEYKDSPTLIAFFKSTYEKVFDYFSILSTVAMPPSSVYDRDAVNMYQLRFFSLMTLHSDIAKLDAEAVVRSFFGGLQPLTLQSICLKHRMKTMASACDLLQQQMTHFDAAHEVNKLSQPSTASAAPTSAAGASASQSKSAAKSSSRWRSSSKPYPRGEANSANLTCFNCKENHHIRDCTVECKGACPRNSASHLPRDCPAFLRKQKPANQVSAVMTIDSGASDFFVNSSFRSSLSNFRQAPAPMPVTMPNGAIERLL